MIKSDFVARKKFEKPRWKCPDCRTINRMDYSCPKCKMDCFSFNPPPSLAKPDENEEVKKEASPRPSLGTKLPIAERKPATSLLSQKQGEKGSIYDKNPDEYWECV